MALVNVSNLVDRLMTSQLLDQERCDELQRIRVQFADARGLAQEILNRDWLTAFQINQILQGKGSDLTVGPYVLFERLGEGGMGQVYKARHKVLQRIVALKVIRRECLNNKKVIARFQREIRAAGQLNHPHIVRAYDADQVNGVYYIAMEYIDGVDLAKMIKDEGPIKVQRACEYIRQAALGLQHAYERGVVHRDIKPANLFYTKAVSADRRRSSGVIRRPLNLDERKKNSPPRQDAALQYPFGVIKILDMGLARYTDKETGQTSTHLTQLGSVMGTPEFIAPEQARDSHTSDIRADLYSLGCTLYFLLAGQPPFPNGTVTEKLLQHQSHDPEPVEQVRRQHVLQVASGTLNADEMNLRVPRRVEEVIRKLMAKRPEDRYQTPLELAEDLQVVVNKLADGSLMAQDATERTATMPAMSDAQLPSGPDATVIMTPIIIPPAKQRDRLATKATVVLAAAGGLVVVLVVTVIAVLMSLSGLSRASGVPNEPVPKVKEAR